jgi:Fic family protein
MHVEMNAMNQHITNSFIKLEGLLAEAYKEIENISADESAYLQKFALISNIGASTRIENALLTNQEIEWLDTTLEEDGKITAYDEKKTFILDKLSKDRERSIEEVVGCREVLTTIYQQAQELYPLTEITIRGLHHILLKYYPKASMYAGQYKASPNKVVSINHETGEQKTVLDPAPPGTITATAMSDLIAWYNEHIQKNPLYISAACEFMFRFLAIHPFQDGNGRMGRALFILALFHSNNKYMRSLLPYLAIDRHIEQNRAAYYAILHKCSSGRFYEDSGKYKLESLFLFFISMLKSSLNDIIVYRKKYADLQKLSETALTVLTCFKSSPETRMQVAGIIKKTGLPRRTVQYALSRLTEKAFLQRLGQGAGSRYQLVF